MDPDDHVRESVVRPLDEAGVLGKEHTIQANSIAKCPSPFADAPQSGD